MSIAKAEAGEVFRVFEVEIDVLVDDLLERHSRGFAKGVTGPNFDVAGNGAADFTKTVEHRPG